MANATNIISAATALELAYIHQEIERGKEMLVQLDEYDSKEKEAKREAFHVQGVENALRRRVSGYQLGVPHRFGSNDGHYIISGISPDITRHIILAHIEKKKAKLAELCIKARMELNGLVKDTEAETTDEPGEAQA